VFETFAVVSTLSLIGIFVALVQLERAGRAEGTDTPATTDAEDRDKARRTTM
jgi:hypothetical protein